MRRMAAQNPASARDESCEDRHSGEPAGNASRRKPDTDASRSDRTVDFDLGELLGGRSAARVDNPPSRDRSSGGFVVVFLLFGTLVGITLLLLLTALVVWLSQVMGSFIVATLLLAALFALLAAGLYLGAIREAVERIRARAETVYEVARLARSGYEWISDKIALVSSIYRMLRKE